jgi:hypothetical protein
MGSDEPCAPTMIPFGIDKPSTTAATKTWEDVVASGTTSSATINAIARLSYTTHEDDAHVGDKVSAPESAPIKKTCQFHQKDKQRAGKEKKVN